MDAYWGLLIVSCSACAVLWLDSRGKAAVVKQLEELLTEHRQVVRQRERAVAVANALSEENEALTREFLKIHQHDQLHS